MSSTSRARPRSRRSGTTSTRACPRSPSTASARAYYVATRLAPELLAQLHGAILREAGVAAPLAAPAGVEVVRRGGPGGDFTFVLNHSASVQMVALPESMRDLIGGRVYTGVIDLPPRGVAILVALDQAVE